MCNTIQFHNDSLCNERVLMQMKRVVLCSKNHIENDG